MKLAASVEFMHTATLLHDDVVDESDMRRGRKTARIVWGNQASVLVGDFLLGQAFRMMVEAGFMEALDILSSAAAVIAEGEVMQLATAKNLATDEDAYLAVVSRQDSGAVRRRLRSRPVDRRTRRRRSGAPAAAFGMALGQAFQLIDDALDYGGNPREIGKNVGDDFREGKITLPVIIAFERGDGDGARLLAAGDGGGRHPRRRSRTGHRDLAPARRHRGDDARATRFAEEAHQALSIYPDVEMRRALAQAVDFAVERNR